jgi:hypothetical protein
MRLIAAAAIGLLGALALAPAPTTQLQHVSLASAAALPQDRLHFGLANDPSQLSWMTSSGVPWRYRYQYLAGGVNTPNPWPNWNSPTGAFATNYMNDSKAAGYIPVFTYYEMLQSNPSTGGSESDRDFSNLNNASTMAAYYANFKLLMQLAGAFGGTVVVHVEPDLWGYLEQRAGGGGASSLSASVASSGFADAAGLPNTAEGFADELLKLRDTYATNAVLAIHASLWSSGIDIASDTSASVNAASVADATAAFLNSAGVASNPYGTTWDLVFNDIDDHDAGWWEQQGADNASFTHWWDPTNQKFPNFTRYLAWVNELHARTARPQVVWQVPTGNQYFLTMNNTCGHYQDNVASYLIAHPDDLYAAGLIAVMFGAGNGCQTSYADVIGDGVTNNGGTPTTDLAGGCNACNTHVSSWADDDGGYLRTFVAQYYAGWKSYGGVLTTGPAAAAAGTNQDAFVRGTDNALWQAHVSNGTFTGWSSLGGVLTADPGATALSGGSVDVFATGTDRQLWTRTWNGSAWGAWTALGGVLTAGPGAASGASTNEVDVFARGTDMALWTRRFDGTTWGSWQSLGGVLTSNPAAVSWGSGRIDVFVRGTDNALWTRSWTSSGWSAWSSLGGILTQSPAVTSCTSGHLDLFVIGVNGVMWQRSYTGSWGGWNALGAGFGSTSIAATCQPATTNVTVWGRGADLGLWSRPATGT